MQGSRPSRKSLAGEDGLVAGKLHVVKPIATTSSARLEPAETRSASTARSWLRVTSESPQIHRYTARNVADLASSRTSLRKCRGDRNGRDQACEQRSWVAGRHPLAGFRLPALLSSARNSFSYRRSELLDSSPVPGANWMDETQLTYPVSGLVDPASRPPLDPLAMRRSQAQGWARAPLTGLALAPLSLTRTARREIERQACTGVAKSIDHTAVLRASPGILEGRSPAIVDCRAVALAFINSILANPSLRLGQGVAVLRGQANE